MSGIRERMRRNLLTVCRKQTLEGAAQAMFDRKVKAVVVVGAAGTLAGILTKSDILKAATRGLPLWNTLVTDAMTREKDVATVGPDITEQEALELMRERCCRHLPVVEDDKVVGILALHDLVGVP